MEQTHDAAAPQYGRVGGYQIAQARAIHGHEACAVHQKPGMALVKRVEQRRMQSLPLGAGLHAATEIEDRDAGHLAEREFDAHRVSPHIRTCGRGIQAHLGTVTRTDISPRLRAAALRRAVRADRNSAPRGKSEYALL